MRFLMLNWRDPKNPLTGGAERVTLAYLSALAARGHEVFWYANDFPGALPEETFDGIHFVRDGGKGSSVLKARAWYRRQKPFDLVMDQHHGIPWYAPWWCKTNCVSYVHEVLGPIWNTFYPWPLSAIGQFQERWTHWSYRNVPFWTACESTRDHLQRHGVKDVHIIRYGVNTEVLPALNAKPIAQPLLLSVASRLAPNKRIDHCIRTLSVLVKRSINARITIVGGGEDDQKLRSLTAGLQLNDRVQFTGMISEQKKDEILRASHFLLHTSVREGWGLNVIEANANGTPAAVYPVPGLKESTLHDQTGLVAKNETPEALADELIGILRDDVRYQRFRHAAWERARTMHWRNILPLASEWFEARARGEKSVPVVIPS